MKKFYIDVGGILSICKLIMSFAKALSGIARYCAPIRSFSCSEPKLFFGNAAPDCLNHQYERDKLYCRMLFRQLDSLDNGIEVAITVMPQGYWLTRQNVVGGDIIEPFVEEKITYPASDAKYVVKQAAKWLGVETHHL